MGVAAGNAQWTNTAPGPEVGVDDPTVTKVEHQYRTADRHLLSIPAPRPSPQPHQ
jgi:hypothetical protein